jgi:hypothetical protein
MRNITPMPVAALLVVLVVSAAACRKENKAEQLAALENAYRSGVLTQAEYDAKRLALVGPPPAALAAPVAAPPAANPVTPQNPPSGTPAAPAGAVAGNPAPSGLAAPVPARPQTAAAAPPVTPPRAAPVPATSAREPELPAAQTRPAPPTSASEPEPEPLPGCEDAEYSSGNVKGARQRFYPAPMDSVKRAAAEALRSLDFNIHTNAGNEMEASKRRHISAIVGAGGERLILHFQKAQQGSQTGTLVTGETRKSLVGRMAQKSWTNAVLAQIACHLREGR